MDYKSVSIFLALILRHKPEQAGIYLDRHGWANVDELVKGISKKYHGFNIDILEEIVRTDEKQRYSFNNDHTLIRANQGHSIPVDVELEAVEPPEYLYHGIGWKYESQIEASGGLIPKSRLYVHLSSDGETAISVGKRHCKDNETPLVYRIRSGVMHRDGFTFYKSVNGVWLTEEVPIEYMEYVSVEHDIWGLPALAPAD
jgi:putative RNA 2'-phosphotransferase